MRKTVFVFMLGYMFFVSGCVSNQTRTAVSYPITMHTWISDELLSAGYENKFSLLQYRDICAVSADLTKSSSKRNVKLYVVKLKSIYEGIRSGKPKDVEQHVQTMNLGDTITYQSDLVDLIWGKPIDKCPKLENVSVTIPREKFNVSEHSSVQLKKILANFVEGKGLNWCPNANISSLFAPRSYKILGDNDQDHFIESSGHWSNIYKVRIESSNKGGSPIIHDWSFFMQNQGSGWCLWAISE